MRFEEPPCPLCGSHQRTLVLTADDWHFGLGTDFRVVRCKDCGFHYTCPRPTREAIGDYYPDHYWGEDGATTGVTRGMRALLARRAGRLLDVGCGQGDFLAEAARHGWIATGVEPGREAVHRGQALGRDVRQGTLDDVQEGDYDLITLLDVLEHLHEPVKALRRCADLLTTDGRVIVRLPNFASWERRLFGPHWYGLQVPTHLHHFTARDVARAAEQAGLRTEHVEGVRVSFFVPSLHQALKARRGDTTPLAAAPAPPQDTPRPTSDSTLNWKGRLVWDGIRALERLAQALPPLHERLPMGPIVCLHLRRA